MKLIFFSHDTQLEHVALIAGALLDRYGLTSELWTLGGIDFEQGKKHSVFTDVVDLLAGVQLEPSSSQHHDNLQWLRRLEDQLGAPFFQQDVAMDRYFRALPTAELNPAAISVRWTHKRVAALMRHLGANIEHRLQQDDILGGYMETNSATYRLAWRLFNQRGLPVVWFHTTRGAWRERGYFESGLGGSWCECQEMYETFKQEGIPEPVETLARQRLHDIRERAEQPQYFTQYQGSPNKLLSLLRAPQTIVGEATHQLSTWRKARQRSVTNPRALPSGVHAPTQQLRRQVRIWQSQRYYDRHFTLEGPPSEDYAAYFLHVQPEDSVEGMAFEYQDQVATLRNLAAALPANIALAVKEHKPTAGRRPIEFYAELAHIPNLRLIRHTANAHEIIQGARLTLTLTGTIALESLYYGVPTVALGDVFFSRFAGVYAPKNFSEVRQLLRDVDSLRGATDDEAVRALAAMHACSFSAVRPIVANQDNPLAHRAVEQLYEVLTNSRQVPCQNNLSRSNYPLSRAESSP